MKKRSILLMIVFMIITFGIYGVYWYCSFQNQLKRKTGMGFGGCGHFFATMFSFGIYGLYWSFVVGKRIKACGGSNNGLIYFLLSFFALGVVAYCLMQHEVNQIA